MEINIPHILNNGAIKASVIAQVRGLDDAWRITGLSSRNLCI
jgi:hypothetical protein